MRAAVQAAIAAEGLGAFVRRSGASEKAILRAVAGLDVRRGTAALLEAALREAGR